MKQSKLKTSYEFGTLPLRGVFLPHQPTRSGDAGVCGQQPDGADKVRRGPDIQHRAVDGVG